MELHSLFHLSYTRQKMIVYHLGIFDSEEKATEATLKSLEKYKGNEKNHVYKKFTCKINDDSQEQYIWSMDANEFGSFIKIKISGDP